jgi:uncharacterized phiE125 gp8 family phage protein
LHNYPILKERYTNEPISLDEAQEWLRLDIEGYEDEDTVLAALVESAIDYVERECNLSLGVSTYEWYPDYLPCEIRDTYYIRSITSIEVEGESGFELIQSTNYSLIPASERRTKIRWIEGFSSTGSNFRVTFKAGFEEGKIPPRILLAVRVLLSKFYENRGDNAEEKKTVVDRLLSSFKIPYFG